MKKLDKLSLEKSTNEDFAQADSLIKLIEFEVNRIELEHKQPGWSLWAIEGVFCGVVWAILSELQLSGNTISIQHVFRFLIFFWFLFDVLQSVMSYLSKENLLFRAAPFYFESDIISPFKPAFYQNRNRYIFFFLLSLTALLFSRNQLTFYSIWFYAIFAFTATLKIIISSKIPFVKSAFYNLSFHGLMCLAGINILLLAIGWKTLFILDLKRIIPLIPEFKIACLIFVGSYLTCRYLSNKLKKFEMLLPNLIRMRRDIALRRRDLKSLTDELEIILLGLSGTDFYKKQLHMYLDLIGSASNRLERINQEGNLLLADAQRSNYLLDNNQLAVFHNFLNLANKDLVITTNELEQGGLIIKEFVKRFDIVLNHHFASYSEGISEIDGLIQKLQSSLNSLNNKNKEAIELCDGLLSMINEIENVNSRENS